MSHFGKCLGVALVIVFPMVVSADSVEQLAEFEANSGLLANLSLWSTIIVAFATSVMVWIGGRHMHGGAFGRVLMYYSVGMTLIFLGFATEVPWFQKIPSIYLKLVHDSLYIIGYILMGVATSRLLRVLKGE